MPHPPINFAQKLSSFTDRWSPKVIAEMNDYQFKLVKLQGDFVWHQYKDTDEVFIVIKGNMRIDFRDGAVHLSAGEMYVVPKGTEHKPYAEYEVEIMLIEPRGVVNTGDAVSELTANKTFGSRESHSFVRFSPWLSSTRILQAPHSKPNELGTNTRLASLN